MAKFEVLFGARAFGLGNFNKIIFEFCAKNAVILYMREIVKRARESHYCLRVYRFIIYLYESLYMNQNIHPSYIVVYYTLQRSHISYIVVKQMQSRLFACIYNIHYTHIFYFSQTKMYELLLLYTKCILIVLLSCTLFCCCTYTFIKLYDFFFGKNPLFTFLLQIILYMCSTVK